MSSFSRAFSYPKIPTKGAGNLAKQREANRGKKLQAERVAQLPNTALENMYWNMKSRRRCIDAARTCYGRWCETYHPNAVETIHRELPVS